MKRILICEDEQDIQKSLTDLLSRKDFEVHNALDGEEAINKTKGLKPDLVLLDIRMPKLDGLEVAKEIRKFDDKTKILFITGFQSPELSKEAAKYNIVDYIVKPSSAADILKVIEKALS